MQNLVWLYFSLKGRLNRNGFWFLYILPAIAIGLTAYWAASALDANEIVEPIVAFGLLWPSIAIQVKRWHDIDMSGWWVLINLVPFIGTLGALIANGFVSGTTNENRFGPAESNIGSARRP